MRQVAERPDRYGKPLSEPVLLILISLASEPRHGYALIQDIERLSLGRVRLSTGTLYGALPRLLEEGWIGRFAQEEKSREKQAYRLTASGRRQLGLELDRMKRLTKAASLRLRASEV
jgi:DNA-binding PadR family transcriptional regulator